MTDLPALLQLADAAFPAGGFGHSFGLETAIVDGRVRDGATLRAWIESFLLDTCATLDGAAMALLLHTRTTLERLDERLVAAQPNAEIRRANAHLARATLDTYIAMGLEDERADDAHAEWRAAGAGARPGDREPGDHRIGGRSVVEARSSGVASACAVKAGAHAIRAYRRAIGAGRCAGIHALAAALGYRAIGAAPRTALEAHATTIVTACASVAARAVPLGQRDIARIRWTLHPAIATFVARALAARSIEDLRAGAVACEIDGLQHRRLPARLFAS